MTNSPIYVQPTEADWINVAPGVRRRMLCHDESLMMVEVAFEKGAIGAMHAHPHIQVSLVVSGMFELDIGGDKKVLKTGDSYRVPANVVHGAIALEPGVLIDTFTPHREDFLA